MDGPVPTRLDRDPLSVASHTSLPFVMAIGLPLAVLWTALAFHPNDRADWLLENALTACAIVLLAVTWRTFRLRRSSYVVIGLFLALHTVGAHYTYAEVPYDSAFRQLTGTGLNQLLGWERNNFDRLVHFAYGLLLSLPIREVFVRVARVDGFWSYFLPLDLTMSSSMLYELLEWAAALLFGGDLGMAYLGTQGDVWDAHKDMALASLGALITLCFTAFLHRRAQRA